MRRLAKERFGADFPVPSTFDWVPSWEEAKLDSEAFPVLNLIDGVYEPSGKSLKEGMLLRLLRVLASDFVSPLSEYVLHELLYPGQSHRGRNSTRQLHTLIHRLRSWLKANKVPLEVECVKGAYRISPESRIRLRLFHPDAEPKLRSVFSPSVRATWQLILKKYGKNESISSAELAKLRKISMRSSVYHLQKLVAAQRLRASGSGPATRYYRLEE
jgi:hypothetical protein